MAHARKDEQGCETQSSADGASEQIGRQREVQCRKYTVGAEENQQQEQELEHVCPPPDNVDIGNILHGHVYIVIILAYDTMVDTKEEGAARGLWTNR